MADIFDFDSCVNQRESNKVRYWGSEGYGGANRGTPYVKGSRKKRRGGNRGYCPKTNKPAKRKKLTIKQLNSIKIGTQLKLFWPPTKTWSYGEVINIYDDGMYEIACHDDPADQGALVYHLADYTFKITHSPEEAEHYDPIGSHHEPHPQASRRSSRIPKKRKLFEISTNTGLRKRTKGEGLPKMNKDVLVEKKTETSTEQEVADEMMKDVLVQKKKTIAEVTDSETKENPKSDTPENPKSETPENPNTDTREGVESKEDGKNDSSVVVSLNRSR